MKKFPRVLGIDDGFFRPGTRTKTILIGVIYRFGHIVEGIVSSEIRVDALDSTEKIIRMLAKTKFSSQVSFLIMSGINFAGFNIADVKKIFEKTGIPAIIVFRKKPRMEKFVPALKKVPNFKKRISLIEQAGEAHSFKNFFFQFYGCTEQDAKEVLRKTILHSSLPEPVRLAHLIASGVTIGESTRPK
ncbi:MAG: DUF99 family protein [Candidatus ainarchaeum sp.]|nr:DUF99 family protein [Candidatus ainarchaeum sp.]